MNYERRLLAELRDHVTNDLALIVDMLETERKNSAALTVEEALDNAVGALLSLTIYYRQLYELSNEVDLLDLNRHLEGLIDGLRDSYLDRRGVTVDCRLDRVLVPPATARDLGLIVVELVANAAKHALRRQGGRIGVELEDTADALICRVSDDGRGLELADREGASGLAVATQLAANLGASLEVAPSRRWRGPAFVLTVPQEARRQSLFR
jgi:two-component sensor histidine kinase